jgi:alpha-amylase
VSCAPSIEDAATGDWACEHRDPAIAAMVEFRSATAGQAVTGWWDDGAWAVAFSRGDRGFVALSLAASPVTVDVATPVAPGTYCDLITGGLAGGACAGRSVTVGADGRVQVELASGEAVAIHTGTRL